MFAIGADSDNPADGERGGPTLQHYLFGRILKGFRGFDLILIVNESAFFNYFKDGIPIYTEHLKLQLQYILREYYWYGDILYTT